jgi:hypothetical protein
MLRGEHKVLYCTDGVIVEPGRKLEAVDSEGVDTLENRSKEAGEGGMATGVVIVELTAVDKDERGIVTEDDRAVLGGEGW